MKYLLLLIILMTASISIAGETLDVAWTIYQEAKGESFEGKLAVATVIHNRSIRRELSLSGVCKQYKQFSCWNSGRKPKVVDTDIWRQCEQIAQSMTDGVFRPIDSWDHYFNPSKCSPSWDSDLVHISYIGGHKFGVLI